MSRTRCTEEEKTSLVSEFFGEYQESRCYATDFARKKGINESTFLEWVRKYDIQGVYPICKQVLPKVEKHDMVLVESDTRRPVSDELSI
jgi:hypothetical protein